MHHEPSTLSELLRSNKQTYLVDLLEYSLLFEDEPFKSALLPSPKGLYLVGEIDPRLTTDKVYFDPVGLEQGVPFTGLEAILESSNAVLNESGQVLIPKSSPQYKKKFWSTEPSVPSGALKLIKALIGEHIGSVCRHTRCSVATYHSGAYNYIRPEMTQLLESGQMAELIEKLFDEVNLFIGNDIWHIYFWDLKGTTLKIEKTVDFRIYEYYRQKFEAEND